MDVDEHFTSGGTRLKLSPDWPAPYSHFPFHLKRLHSHSRPFGQCMLEDGIVCFFAIAKKLQIDNKKTTIYNGIIRIYCM